MRSTNPAYNGSIDIQLSDEERARLLLASKAESCPDLDRKLELQLEADGPVDLTCTDRELLCLIETIDAARAAEVFDKESAESGHSEHGAATSLSRELEDVYQDIALRPLDEVAAEVAERASEFVTDEHEATPMKITDHVYQAAQEVASELSDAQVGVLLETAEKQPLLDGATHSEDSELTRAQTIAVETLAPPAIGILMFGCDPSEAQHLSSMMGDV